MTRDISDYLVNCQNVNPKEVVSIPVSLFESKKGNYFVGQTKPLFVGNNSNAWAGLVNPCNSNVNLYTNVFTISNFSDDYLTAEIWLNATFPEKVCISHKVSPANTALNPLQENKVDIRFIKSTTATPENGVNVYERILPPNTTLVAEEDGKFIEAPGGSYVVVIKSQVPKPDKVIVAFGWWEKPR